MKRFDALQTGDVIMAETNGWQDCRVLRVHEDGTLTVVPLSARSTSGERGEAVRSASSIATADMFSSASPLPSPTDHTNVSRTRGSGGLPLELISITHGLLKRFEVLAAHGPLDK